MSCAPGAVIIMSMWQGMVMRKLKSVMVATAIKRDIAGSNNEGGASYLCISTMISLLFDYLMSE